MIKFFRRIRQKLLEENRFSKYLFYALGEIILVMVGILLALQVNNFNEQRKNRELETKYLRAIQDDLILMKAVLEKGYLDRFDQKIEALLQAKAYAQGQSKVLDTLKFLRIASYGGVASGAGLTIQGKGTFQELLSTGSLRLIVNDSLRKNLRELYNFVESREKVFSGFVTEYASFINSLRPFDYKNPDIIEYYDQIEMIKALKSQRFAQLVDRELSFAYKIQRDCDVIIARGTALQNQLQEELKNRND